MNEDLAIRNRAATALLLVALLSFAATAGLCAEDAILTLGDFRLQLKYMRSQQSVEREQPVCIGATGGTNVTFTSEGEPFQIVGVTLVAKREGEMTLIPELFVLRDYMWHRECHGIRIVKPLPDPRAEAFFPPNNASVEVGHAGDRIASKKGDTIEIELLFDALSDQRDADLLIAIPRVPLRRPNQEQGSAQQAPERDK